MLIAITLLALVLQHIYQRHFSQQGAGQKYSFDDLPESNEAPVTADINQIIEQHIFGVVPVAPKRPVVRKPKPKAVVAPKTRLDITLTGIIDGRHSKTSLAMLEVERGKTIVVEVGEKIGDTEAILHEVLPGEVLIDRDGTIESVKMVRKTLSLASLDDHLFNVLSEPEDQYQSISSDSGVDQALDTLPQPSSVLPETYDEPLDPALYGDPEAEAQAIESSRANDPDPSTAENYDEAQQNIGRNLPASDQPNMPLKRLPIPRALKRL